MQGPENGTEHARARAGAGAWRGRGLGAGSAGLRSRGPESAGRARGAGSGSYAEMRSGVEGKAQDWGAGQRSAQVRAGTEGVGGFEGARGRVNLGAEWAGPGTGLGFGAHRPEEPEGGVEGAGTPPTFRAGFLEPARISWDSI